MTDAPIEDMRSHQHEINVRAKYLTADATYSYPFSVIKQHPTVVLSRQMERVYHQMLTKILVDVFIQHL